MAEPYDDEIDPALLELMEEVDPNLLAGFEDPNAAPDIDPTIASKQMSAYGVDPELTPERIEQLGELTNVGALVPEAGFGQQLKQAALNAVTTDPMELADILTTQFPDTVDVRLSPEGVPVARNKETGYEVAINRPGLSPMDAYQALGLIGSYAPAARWAAQPLWQAGKQVLTGKAKEEAKRGATRQALMRGMAAEGATEYGIQKAQEAAGGRMDPGEVAFTAMTAAVPELVFTPLSTGVRKAYDVVTDNVTIPDGIRKGIEYAREHGRKIATSDALSETLSAPRKIFLRAADRIPLIGTSKMRIRQGQERADTMEHMFSHFGISGENDYAEYIANNFNQQQARKIAEFSDMRGEAFQLLAGKGNVDPKKFMHMLEDQMEHVNKLEPDQARRARNWLTSVYKDFDGLESFTFRDADTFLNSLMESSAQGGPLSDLKRTMADELVKDMSAYAKANDTHAFNRWDLARSLSQKEMDKVHNQALRQALLDGEITPDLVDTVLNKGRGQDLTTLVRNTNDTGKQLIRSRVMAQALRRAGAHLDNLSEWAGKTNNINNLIRVLDRDPLVNKGVRRFFTPEDKAVLEGAKEYLRLTADSGKAFESIGMLAGGSGGQGAMRSWMAALNPYAWASTTAAKTHESDAVRDLLLQLNNTKDTPLKARAIYAELRPLLIGLPQASLQDGRDPFAAEIEPTMFEKFVGGSGLAGKQMVESVGEFLEPAVDTSLEYLRSVTGIGEEEDASSP